MRGERLRKGTADEPVAEPPVVTWCHLCGNHFELRDELTTDAGKIRCPECGAENG